MEHIRVDELIDVYFPMYSILAVFSVILTFHNYNPIYSVLQYVTVYLYAYYYHYIIHYLGSKYSIINNYETHNAIHHNKSIILPRWLELSIESISNLFSILIIIIVQYILNIHIFSSSIVLFVGLSYTFVHILHYSLYGDKIHKEHHENVFCNYEPRIYDILFNTRCGDSSSPYISNINELYCGIGAFALAYALKHIFGLD
jgi:hypothetical protein